MQRCEFAFVGFDGVPRLLRSPIVDVLALEIPNLATFDLGKKINAELAIALAAKRAGANHPAPEFRAVDIQHVKGWALRKSQKKSSKVSHPNARERQLSRNG